MSHDFEGGSASGGNVNLNGSARNGITSGLRNKKPTTDNLGNPPKISGNGSVPLIPGNSPLLNGNGNGNGASNHNQNPPAQPNNTSHNSNNIPSRPRGTTPIPANNGRNPNSGSNVLNGALGAFSPSSILSLLNIQKQTGALYLTSEGITGYIFVEKGEVWDAKLGSVIGAYAMFQLFGWRQGHFSFETEGMPTPKRTIEASLPVLQVRATLWLDNWNKYNQLIPSISHRIVIAPDPRSGVVIEPYQWAVLTKIVARPLSIAELAEELDQDLMTVTRIAADLVRVGVATVRPPENSGENSNIKP